MESRVDTAMQVNIAGTYETNSQLREVEVANG